MPDLSAIDHLFKRWDNKESPGAAAAVIKNDEVIYKRGFGLSNLEHNIPITSSTVFFIGSESKQFTAFAIYLLEQDGCVSLDADIGDYLPDLALAGKGITARHLLHHTSGIRDYVDLHILAGRRLEDYFTHADNLRLIKQQKTLNFDPGENFLYSNSGYALLTEIVTQQSGMTFSKFCQLRLFEPLGMGDTTIEPYNGSTAPGLATSYAPEDSKPIFQRLNCTLGAAGAGGILSTIDDLIRWDANFRQPVVGDAAVLNAMMKPGKLNDGKTLDYASGLVIDTDGQKGWIDHGGSIAGYRSNLLRLTTEKLSVIVLGNASSVPANILAHDIANIILGNKAHDNTATDANSHKDNGISVKDIELTPLIGSYELRPGFILKVFVDGDRFCVQATGQKSVELHPLSKNAFSIKEIEGSVEFDGSIVAQKIQSATLFQNDTSYPLKRIAEFEAPDSASLRPLEGNYFCAELNTMIQLVLKDDTLVAKNQRDELKLNPLAVDEFSIAPLVQSIVFKKNLAGVYCCCNVSTSRARNVLFERVDLPETLKTDQPE